MTTDELVAASELSPRDIVIHLWGAIESLPDDLPDDGSYVKFANFIESLCEAISPETCAENRGYLAKVLRSRFRVHDGKDAPVD